MFSQVIRSFLLLQVILIVAPLTKTSSVRGWRFLALKGGSFLCMLSIVFCDVQLLPEIFGALLVFINILMAEKEARQSPAWWNCVLFLSLVVFVLSVVFRSGVLDWKRRRDDTSLVAISKDVGGCGSETVDGVISMKEAEKMVKAAYEHLHGEGSHEKSQIEKSETDSAYLFSSSLPDGSNYVFKVMKKDGKEVSSVKSSHPKDE